MPLDRENTKQQDETHLTRKQFRFRSGMHIECTVFTIGRVLPWLYTKQRGISKKYVNAWKKPIKPEELASAHACIETIVSSRVRALAITRTNNYKRSRKSITTEKTI